MKNRNFFATTATTLITILIANSGLAQTDANIYHYSSLEAMRNGVYQGSLTVKEAKTKGNFGLGSYELLDGELVADGTTFYQVKADGRVLTPPDETLIPYTGLTLFNPSVKPKDLPNQGNIKDLLDFLYNSLPNKNVPYAIKIEGEGRQITLGGSEKLDKDDHRPLAEVLQTRPHYQHKSFAGTVVGFYTPDYLGRIEVPGFHLHFISKDKKFGGHLLEVVDFKGKLYMDEKKSYVLDIPQNNEGYYKMWKKEKTQQGY